MGAIDVGSQKIVFKYKTPLDADILNQLIHNVITPGVVSGFALSFVGDVLTIGAGAVVISDGSNTVRVNTISSFDLTMSASNLLVVVRFTFLEVVANYADFVAVDASSVLPTDVILASVVFDASGSIISTKNFYQSYRDVVYEHSTGATYLFGSNNETSLIVSAGTVLVILPPIGGGEHRHVFIKNIHASLDVTIQGDGFDTIDGDLTLVLNTQYQTVHLANSGSNWYIL